MVSLSESEHAWVCELDDDDDAPWVGTSSMSSSLISTMFSASLRRFATGMASSRGAADSLLCKAKNAISRPALELVLDVAAEDRMLEGEEVYCMAEGEAGETGEPHEEVVEVLEPVSSAPLAAAAAEAKIREFMDGRDAEDACSAEGRELSW